MIYNDFEDYRTLKQRVDEEYKFSHKEMEAERLEKLEVELALIDNTPLTKSKRDTEVKRVKDLYAPYTYKSDKCIEYEKAIEEMEDTYLSELKAQYGDVVDSVYDACYARAWEAGHSSGYDNVANHLDEEIEHLLNLEKLLGIKIITK